MHGMAVLRIHVVRLKEFNICMCILMRAHRIWTVGISNGKRKTDGQIFRPIFI